MGALQSSPVQREYADLAEKTGCECLSGTRARAYIFHNDFILLAWLVRGVKSGNVF